MNSDAGITKNYGKEDGKGWQKMATNGKAAEMNIG
jgi:hypothetical protein